MVKILEFFFQSCNKWFKSENLRFAQMLFNLARTF